MPPAIWNEGSGMPRARRRRWPPNRNATRTMPATMIARVAIILRCSSFIEAVTIRKTGIVPIGSISTHIITNSLMMFWISLTGNLPATVGSIAAGRLPF